MKVTLVGDVHADFRRLKWFVEHVETDMILACGDFGYWPKWRDAKNQLDQINSNVPIYFCDGNHEDHEALAALTNNEVARNIFYMKRGSTMDIGGIRTLFIGGGLSIDKDYRRAGWDWFAEELITQADIDNLPDTKIDMVISHTSPREFGDLDLYKETFHDPSRDFLSQVLEKYQPDVWFNGHFHVKSTGKVNNTTWISLADTRDFHNWYQTINIVPEEVN